MSIAGDSELRDAGLPVCSPPIALTARSCILGRENRFSFPWEISAHSYANICRNRYRIELVQVEDCQGCGAPVEDTCGRSRGDAAGGERVRVGAGFAGGDGADAAGAEAVSAG